MSKDVISVLKTVAKQNDLKIDFNNRQATLKDIGIDSLALLNLIFKVEGQLGVQISNSKLIAIKNLGDLIDALNDAVENAEK